MSPRAYFKGRDENAGICGLRRCRLVPVLRAETKTQESVDLRRCRLVPVLRAETNTVKIVENVRVYRLVPVKGPRRTR